LTIPSPISPLYVFWVSNLSHIPFCPKRSKIETFLNPEVVETNQKRHPIRTGNILHWQYSYPYKQFDRVLCRSRLMALVGSKTTFEKTTFWKQVDNIQVRGRLDDLRILRTLQGKFSSLIEIKTTYKKYLWSREIQAAVIQLQIYMWILKDLLILAKYPLWIRSYVEVYSQNTGYLMRRIPVTYNDQIEDWIRRALRIYQGLERMTPPPFSYCHLCPKPVKELCDWYPLMLEDKRSDKCVSSPRLLL
jgi:CRISPR/Cas system-associated exonuclease Cas4 (RecB family)